jgi:hypothetical protein
MSLLLLFGGAALVEVDGIASTVALGAPIVSPTVTVVPDGIASTVALGSPIVSVAVRPDGIAPGSGLGSPIVALGASPVEVAGIASTAALGDPIAEQAQTAVPAGIGSTAALGSPVVAHGVLPVVPDGIDPTSALGSPTSTLIWNAIVDGIGPGEMGRPIRFVPFIVGRLPVYHLFTMNRDQTGWVELEDGWSGLRFNRVIDADGAAGFTIETHQSAATPANLAIGKRELHIYRDEKRVWGGDIWDLRADGGYVQVLARNWFARTKGRYLAAGDILTFDQISPWDIAWTIWEHFQAEYDMGVVRGLELGARPTHRSAEWSWFDFRTMGDMLVESAQLPDRDFDFELTPHKEWNVMRRNAPESNAFTLEQGVNITAVSYESTFDTFANHVFAKGYGSGETVKYAEASDAGSRADYGMVSQVFDKSRTRSQTNLEDAADNYLNAHLVPYVQPTIGIKQEDIDWDDIVLGLRYPIIYNDGFLVLNDHYRLTGHDVQPQPSGRELVSVTMDDPGSIF